eukprot:scaffold6369_cov73-Cyclotella_meneghiniana.AAC.1
MGSLQTCILHSDGKWVQGRSKPEISYEFLLRARRSKQIKQQHERAHQQQHGERRGIEAAAAAADGGRRAGRSERNRGTERTEDGERRGQGRVSEVHDPKRRDTTAGNLHSNQPRAGSNFGGAGKRMSNPKSWTRHRNTRLGCASGRIGCEAKYDKRPLLLADCNDPHYDTRNFGWTVDGRGNWELGMAERGAGGGSTPLCRPMMRATHAGWSEA